MPPPPTLPLPLPLAPVGRPCGLQQPPRLTVPLLLALALMGSSCGFKHEPLGDLPAYPQTVRDGLNREIHVDTAPKRIVSLDPGMTSALYAIGAGNLAAGGSGQESYP